METAATLVKDVLYEIQVQADEQDVKSIDFETALRSINRMMSQYDSQGIKLGWTILVNPADPVTIPAGAVNGVIYNAALKLCTSYDYEPSSLLIQNAQDGMDAMMKIGVSIGKMNYPSTLPIGSGNEDDLVFENHFFLGCEEDLDECDC